MTLVWAGIGFFAPATSRRCYRIAGNPPWSSANPIRQDGLLRAYDACLLRGGGRRRSWPPAMFGLQSRRR
jgi:hypothetical protein